ETNKGGIWKSTKIHGGSTKQSHIAPAINIHVKCGSFTQDLVNPRLLKVLGKGDCVVNAGLPLGPLQKISFNYTHTKFNISTSTRYFQCE
ncbi:hypothetical protein MKW92_024780, partial [Papaver armeniacum]